ncbi:hypothetical protein ACFFRR_006531 [Megaselia abdita]
MKSKKVFVLLLSIGCLFYLLLCLFSVNSKHQNTNGLSSSPVGFEGALFIDSDCQRITNYLEEHLFNERGNDNRIKINRRGIDARDRRCVENSYEIPDGMRASVIITYFNETKVNLFSTILSVVKKTTRKHLAEVIIIDDCSNDDSVYKSLRILASRNLRIKRNCPRKGLIESRNYGAEIATAEYITFLDSHCEVNSGWIEPLLARIRLFPGLAVSPILDSLDFLSGDYQFNRKNLKGGFDWNLNFKWIPRNRDEFVFYDDDGLINIKSPSDPFMSPVFAGGIFMISREWFFKLNGFNPLIKIWGGESIEMSIKLWLCGGQIEIVPCSRIGHSFQKLHLFDFPNGKKEETYLMNLKIIAESWLDEYKHFFYSQQPKARNLPEIQVNATNLMKSQLQCRPFSWYLQSIFKELKYPNDDYLAFGRLSSGGGSKCLVLPKINGELSLRLRNCYDHVNNVEWFHQKTTGRLISSEGFCPAANNRSQLLLERCNQLASNHPQQSNASGVNTGSSLNSNLNTNPNSVYCEWRRSGGHLIHEFTKLCLDNPVSDVITLTECRRGAPSQLFSFSVEIENL